MKFSMLATLVLVLFASCQQAPKTNDYLARQKITAEEYKARIKAEKKRQAELDLPYRMLSPDQKIESLAFIPGTDLEPANSVWAHIEKNRPSLAVLLTDSGASALDPAYRSVREKVPFMAVPKDSEGSRSDYVRSWPYVKNFVDSDSIYHTLIFGEKKETVQVIMLDSFRLDEAQWKWLADELMNPTAVSVVVSAKSPTESEREKFVSLLKKSKQKNIVWFTGGLENSKINRTTVAQANIYELNPRSSFATTTLGGDGPIQIAKSADFGLLKFDWQKRVAVFEIRNSSDEKVESMETTF